MAQFAPMFSLLVYFYVWFVFLFFMSCLWWASKRPYSF